MLDEGRAAVRIVAGRHRGRKLAAPSGRAVRPTTDRTREALFNILNHAAFAAGLPQAPAVLDAFAGSGALGLEALSRGAARVTFLEQDRTAAGLIAQNIRTLGEQGRAVVLHRDATQPGPAPEAFDLVLLDAPYNSGLSAPALAALAAGGWLTPRALAVAELAAGEDFAVAPGFWECDRRRYGRAQLVFLAIADETPGDVTTT